MTQEELTSVSIPNVPIALKEKLEKLAEADKRKLSAYLRIVLEKHVQAVDSPESARQPAPVAA